MRSLAALVLVLAACGDNLAPGEPDAPGPAGGPTWSLVVLPDTQAYVERYPEVLYAQTKWIAENAAALRTQYVLHVGDISQWNVPHEWQIVRRAFDMLAGVVPTAVAPGNHDYDDQKVRTSGMTAAFPVDEVQALPGFVSLFEPDRVESSAHRFEVDGEKWLVLAIEWGPRDAVLAWAGRLLDEHPDHHAVIVTHAYLYSDDTRYDWKRKGQRQGWNPHSYPARIWPEMNDGEEIWKKLIEPRDNVRLVVSGHVADEGVGRLTSTTRTGTRVHQLLADYQAYPMGGGGYLRVLTFSPGRIDVSTYSPWLDAAYFDPDNHFTLTR